MNKSDRGTYVPLASPQEHIPQHLNILYIPSSLVTILVISNHNYIYLRHMNNNIAYCTNEISYYHLPCMNKGSLCHVNL